MSFTYKDAGVDIDAAAAMLARVRQAITRTHNACVLPTLADFGGLYALQGYREPVLVAGTDGVGTKLKIAFALDKHDTIGQDLVAMCVDDVAAMGARPLFFLDYFATGKLKPETAEAVITGIAAACEKAGCALLGGETAELPGFYAEGEYELAGFAVGVVERSAIIDGRDVAVGDLILGLASSGLHSNGYSLARKILLESAGLRLEQPIAELGQTLGEALLEPTRLYAPELLAMQAAGLRPHGLAHITGGGWPDNLARVVPEGLCAVCNPSAVPVPSIFSLIQQLGKVEREEMYRTFNMGVGMALIVAPQEAEAFREFFAARGLPVWPIGHIEAGNARFRWAC